MATIKCHNPAGSSTNQARVLIACLIQRWQTNNILYVRPSIRRTCSTNCSSGRTVWTGADVRTFWHKYEMFYEHVRPSELIISDGRTNTFARIFVRLTSLILYVSCVCYKNLMTFNNISSSTTGNWFRMDILGEEWTNLVIQFLTIIHLKKSPHQCQYIIRLLTASRIRSIWIDWYLSSRPPATSMSK